MILSHSSIYTEISIRKHNHVMTTCVIFSAIHIETIVITHYQPPYQSSLASGWSNEFTTSKCQWSSYDIMFPNFASQ